MAALDPGGYLEGFFAEEKPEKVRPPRKKTAARKPSRRRPRESQTKKATKDQDRERRLEASRAAWDKAVAQYRIALERGVEHDDEWHRCSFQSDCTLTPGVCGQVTAIHRESKTKHAIWVGAESVRLECTARLRSYNPKGEIPACDGFKCKTIPIDALDLRKRIRKTQARAYRAWVKTWTVCEWDEDCIVMKGRCEVGAIHKKYRNDWERRDYHLRLKDCTRPKKGKYRFSATCKQGRCGLSSKVVR